MPHLFIVQSSVPVPHLPTPSNTYTANLLVLFCYRQVLGVFCRHSDEGYTWSAPSQMPEMESPNRDSMRS